MTIENHKDMQLNMKHNVWREQFISYGYLIGRYLEKEEKAALRGIPIMVNYWHRKALKYAEARDAILEKFEALSVE